MQSMLPPSRPRSRRLWRFLFAAASIAALAMPQFAGAADRFVPAAPEAGATALPALAAPEAGPALRQAVPAAITVQPVPREAARPAAPAAAARVALERSVEPAAARRDITDADSGTAGRRGQAVPAAPPVVIGQISVNVAAPAVAADPFAGCRAHAAARAAVRGGGW